MNRARHNGRARLCLRSAEFQCRTENHNRRAAQLQVATFAGSTELFRSAVRNLHAAGPRPVGELLVELAAAFGPTGAALIVDRLEAYSAVPPEFYAAVGADDWPGDAA